MTSVLSLLNAKKQQTAGVKTGGTSIASKLQSMRGISPDGVVKPPVTTAPEDMEKMMTDQTELPFGATGWNPDGTANYGEGVEGWWKGITSRIYAPTVETVGGVKTETPAEPLDTVIRAEGEAFNQLIAGLTYPQQSLYKYIADRRSYEMYADMVNPNSPDIYNDDRMGNFLRITSSLVPGISNLTTMYEKDRIRTGNRMLPDGTFEKIQEANRIWNKDNVGTAIFDTQVQAEYVRRVLAGEDPYKLTKEYAKPVQNFIADFLLDPLNVFEGLGIANKVLGKGMELAKGARTAIRYVDDAKIFENAARAAKMVNETDFVKTATRIAGETAEVVSGNLNMKSGLFDLTQSAKQVNLFDKVFGVFGPLLKFANGDGAKLTQLMGAIGKMGSSDAKIVKEGLELLQENKLLHLFMSDNAFEAARFLNKVTEKTKLVEKVYDLANATEKAKFFDEFRKITEGVLDDLYPDIVKVADAQDEIAKIRKLDAAAELTPNLAKYDNIKLSSSQKYIAKKHRALQETWFGTKVGVKPINEFFALIYLTSPGFTVRNYLNAAVTAFVDLGPGVLRELTDFTGGGYKYIEDMFGFVPGSISKQFSLAQDVKEAKGVMKYFDFMRKAAGKGEEFESVAIAANAGKRFSNDMLKEGRFIESMNELEKAGFSKKSLAFLEKKVREFNGQTWKALDAFKKEFNLGRIEHFREPEVIFSQELLDSMPTNMVDDLRNIMKEGTLEEILAKVDNIIKEDELKMYSTVDDIPATHTDEVMQSVDGLQESLGLSDDGLDQFAKKVNVRRGLENSIIGAADALLADSKLIRNGISEIASRITIHQSKFSTSVRDLVTRIRNGSLGIKEAIEIVGKDPMYARMGEYAPKLNAGMGRDTAIEAIWIYYKKSMEDMWVNSAKQQFDLLMNALGDTSKLKGNKFNVLENLKLKFSTDFKYLNAGTLANGEALISEPYFYYKIGNRVESVLSYGRQLGLFGTEVQKGMKTGKKIGYHTSVFELMKRELTRLGLDSVEFPKGASKIEFAQLGDLNREDVYRFVMARLNEYAVKRNKLVAMKDTMETFLKNVDERLVYLKELDPLRRSKAQGKELAELTAKQSIIGGMKRLINKKLQTARVDDIEEFTAGFAEWFSKHIDDTDVASIIEDAAKNTPEFAIDDLKKIIVDELTPMTKQVNKVTGKATKEAAKVASAEDVKNFDDIKDVGEQVKYPSTSDYDWKDPKQVKQYEIDRKAASNKSHKLLEKKLVSLGLPKQEGLNHLLTEEQELKAAMNLSDNDFNKYVGQLHSPTYEKLVLSSDNTNIHLYQTKPRQYILWKNKQAAAKVASEINIPKLPASLQGAKNTYNYGKKSFNVVFDNDVDRAFYYVGGKGQSKSHNAYYKFLKDIFGDDTDKLIGEVGQDVRNKLKDIAKTAEPGEITIERVFDDYGKYVSTQQADGASNIVKDLAETIQKAADDVVDAPVEMTKIDNMPSVDSGNMPSEAERIRQSFAGKKKMLEAVKKGISDSYGEVEETSTMSFEQDKLLQEWGRLNESKMVDFRMRAMEHMKNVRDFALLDYAGGKKNIDLALAYIFPYQFWYSRSYGNWIKRLVANPAIVNRYANFRDKLEQANANLPDYMKNYVVLGKRFGLEDNPLMLNLEASLNPLNGLTGVDFTDKNKIVGSPGSLEYGWTKTLDSIGKFGPSPWSPINMMTAAYLFNTGEKEAAARWAGRFLPQSMPIKAVGSLLGKNVEIDPFVYMFGDGSGTDPYESRRVGRALIGMSEAHTITREQAYEAARTKSGDVWDQALVQATRNRAWGTISAYSLGQGFKIRSQYEAEIDKFYEEYFKMWANADKFSPDEMSNYQKYIRDKYPFADLAILSGKSSAERDKAYTYSVLSRVAPGQSTEIMKALGVNPNLTDLFYQSKGDMSTWNPLDKENFMNAMVQIGTLVAIPQDTTAQQWQLVKSTYKQVDPMVTAKFGADILDQIETYYEFGYDTNEQRQFMEANPQVQQAMDYKDYLIANTPLLAPYYDGLTRLERYYKGQFRTEVTSKVDPRYYEYYKMRGLIIDPKKLSAFDREVGWTTMQKKYNAVKKDWDMMVFKKLSTYDQFFQKQPAPVMTTVQPNVNPSVGQQSIVAALTPKATLNKVTWNQIVSTVALPISLEKAINNYFTNDKPLTSSENTMLGKLTNVVNDQYGTNYEREDILSLAMQFYYK